MYKQRMIYKYESQCEYVCFCAMADLMNEWMEMDQ